MNALYLIYVGFILAHLYGGMSSVPLWTFGPLVVLAAIGSTARVIIRARPGADHFDVFGEDE